MAKRCPKVGTRVCFTHNPAARGFYQRDAPAAGECGVVGMVPLPGGRATCMPGPRGGLVYVKWDRAPFQGVFRTDLTSARTGRALAGRARRRRR